MSLARLSENELPEGGANDLFAFARLAGQDFYGTGLGLVDVLPDWGRFSLNVAMITPEVSKEPRIYTLDIVIRRTPAITGAQLSERLNSAVKAFNARTGANLQANVDVSDEPLTIDPGSKLVTRLLAAYKRATRHDEGPAISGASSYAKRLPNSVPFGMWFPGTPVPWHVVDEKVSIADLRLGTKALIEAVVNLATGEPLLAPLKP